MADRWGPSWFDDLYSIIAELPQHPDAVQAAIRTKLAEDPIAFAVLYFPHHLENRSSHLITFSEIHFEWARHALSWRDDDGLEPMQNRKAFIGPRESGKSTWWFLILPLWAAVNNIKKFAVAFAHSAGQAEGHLSTLKGELDSNRLLRHDYPDIVTAKRRPGSGVTLADRQGLLHTAKGFVFAAKGADNQVLGLKVGNKRPDLLILDDCEPDESNYSPFMAEKRLSTVTDAIFPLNVYAAVVIVGTVTMPNSITHQLVRHAQGIHCDDCDQGKCWVSSEKIEAHHYRAILMNDDGTERSIWPEQWPLEWLQAYRHTRSYGKNFDNDPLAREGIFWTRDDFPQGDFPCTRTALFVDPVVTIKKTSDYCGLAVVGFAPRPQGESLAAVHPAGREMASHLVKHVPPGRALIKYAAGVKLTGQPLARHVAKILANYPEVRTIVVETNQGGDLWKEVFSSLVAANGDPIKVQTHYADDDKEVRFARDLYYWQIGHVQHRSRFDQLIGQAVAFPRGQYDDVIDAACQGVDYWLAPSKKRKVRSSEHTYLELVS